MKINNIQKNHKLQVENNLEAKKIFLKENNEIAKINGRGVKACETVGMIAGACVGFCMLQSMTTDCIVTFSDSTSRVIQKINLPEASAIAGGCTLLGGLVGHLAGRLVVSVTDLLVLYLN